VRKIAYGQAYQPSNRVPIADTTLGTQVSGNNGNFTITGGINRGQNLFHSFQDFSVPTNGVATFVNPTGNQSIITRVTGRSFSDINGTIDTQGANFLLINPNGVVFGSNTTLNVGRVFAASTANSLDLVDGTGRTVTFGTNTAGDAPLLTVKPDVLFSASRLNMGGGSGAIRNFGNLETNNFNQYIGLVGGDISFNGGQINALSGRVELGGLSAPGSIGLGADRNNPRLSFPVGVARSDLSMNNASSVNYVFGNGNIAITAKNIGLSEKSNINGNVNIHARELTLQNGSSISSGNYFPEGMGNARKINIHVDGAIRIIGSYIGGFDIGNGGDININSHSLTLTNGASIISATVQGSGNGGNINIHARELALQNGSSISSGNYFSGSMGNAGKINIHVDGAIRIIGSYIDGRGEGNGGDININSHSLTLTNGASIVSATVQGSGNTGNVSIRTGDLSLQSGSSISLENLGDIGNTGEINMQVNGAIRIIGGSRIDNSIDEGAAGNGGDINISSRSLLLADNASVSVANNGLGNAGNITILVLDSISINGGNGLNSQASSGNGGNIKIDVNSLILRHMAKVSTNAFGTSQQSNGGDIAIKSKLLIAIPQEDSDITATAVRGQGGNVTIDALGIFGIQFRNQITNRSDITASSKFSSTAPSIDPIKDTNDLTAVPINDNVQISQSCSQSQLDNKFHITGRGGHPPSTNEPLASDVVWSRPSSPPVTTNNPTASTVLQPAAGWILDGQGKATLVAANTEGTPNSAKIICPTNPSSQPVTLNQ
jgi:filamentous hemagglutinin family protein